MLDSLPSPAAPAVDYEYSNWRISNQLPRDQTQSHRLHEPEFRINTIDPMTGNDIEDVSTRPSLADSNLTMYFETEATREAYVDMPINHPNQCLPYPASIDDDRGG